MTILFRTSQTVDVEAEFPTVEHRIERREQGAGAKLSQLLREELDAGTVRQAVAQDEGDLEELRADS